MATPKEFEDKLVSFVTSKDEEPQRYDGPPNLMALPVAGTAVLVGVSCGGGGDGISGNPEEAFSSTTLVKMNLAGFWLSTACTLKRS
jgi:hypothetical protein